MRVEYDALIVVEEYYDGETIELEGELYKVVAKKYSRSADCTYLKLRTLEESSI